MFPVWNWTLIAVSVSFHSVAILSTSFRFWYQWYTARMWWDDAWVVLAFWADVAFLVAAILERPILNAGIPQFFTDGNWIVSFAYPILMWAARISILTSVMHVSHPEGMLRHIAIGVGTLFGTMGIAMLGLRIHLCLARRCLMTRTVLIAQTITECIADALLSALPIWFLHSMKLNRKRKILISSALSASIVIDVVTVVEVVVFFQSVTSGSIVFEHVKVACSLIVCNLLVIVTFVYRVLHKGKAGFEDFMPETRRVVEFTTIDLAQVGVSQDTDNGVSATTKSSSWSFRGGSQSKASGTVTTAMSRIDTQNVTVGSEDEYSS